MKGTMARRGWIELLLGRLMLEVCGGIDRDYRKLLFLRKTIMGKPGMDVKLIVGSG